MSLGEFNELVINLRDNKIISKNGFDAILNSNVSLEAVAEQFFRFCPVNEFMGGDVNRIVSVP